jgi:hypothetical protein
MKPEEEIQVPRWECYTPPEDDVPPEKGYQKTVREIREMGQGTSPVLRRALILVLGILVVFDLLVRGNLEFYLHLFVGWSFLVLEALQSMRVDKLALANSIIAMVVACVVLHWLMVKCFGKTTARPGAWRWKWTLLLAAMVATLYSMCVATVGLVTSVGWANTPTSVTTMGTARQQSRSNARNLVLFARYDAKSSNGVLSNPRPDIFDTPLFAHFYLEDLSQPPVPFMWLGEGLNIATTPGDVPIAVAPQKYADGLRLVAFMDESVKECTEEEWQAALERWRQAVAAHEKKSEVK